MVVVVIFAVMAQFYTYVSDENKADSSSNEDDDQLLLEEGEDETGN